MYFTNYAENKIADFIRGQGLTLPGSWYIGLISAVSSEPSPLELSGTGYARVAVARSLAAWAGTNAVGSTVASTGTSHATSNNALVDFGTSGSAWGTAEFVGLWDASTAGNCWCYLPVTPVVIGNGDPVSFAAGDIAATLALTGGMANYTANKLIDLIWRAQAYSWPSTTYLGYAIAEPTHLVAGTEPLGGYARVGISSSLTAWLSTQGNTAASTGVSGRVTNAAAIVFPVPTADQGTVEWWQLFDAQTGGNLLAFGDLLDSAGSPAAFTVNSGGSAPTFEAGDLGVTVA